MFVGVPTQYIELRDFVNTYENVDIVKPKISFIEVCEKYGFPLISKEVSECVQGARKYLTSIMKSEGLTDRQTDRQTDSLIHTSIAKSQDKASILNEVFPSVDNHAIADFTRGGNDNKYRKLRGIGEYSKRQNEELQGWKQSKISNNIRYADKRQRQSDKGEYP